MPYFLEIWIFYFIPKIGFFLQQVFVKYQKLAIKPSSFYDDIVLKKRFCLACSKSLHVERFNDYVITLIWCCFTLFFSSKTPYEQLTSFLDIIFHTRYTKQQLLLQKIMKRSIIIIAAAKLKSLNVISANPLESFTKMAER